jgi:hypothetical protein
MIDLMTRQRIHLKSEMGTLQKDIAEEYGVSTRSVQRILKEPEPTPKEVVANRREHGPKRGRPSKVTDEQQAKLRALLEAALVCSMRPIPSKEPVVRFEGLPGEYAQFDFGEAKVNFKDGSTQQVQFFGGRLKYSRFMHIEIVKDQTAETLVRSVLRCLTAFGGSPKEWVFDNPKTVRISPIHQNPPVLHPYLGQLVIEHKVIANLCAPRSGNQKGSVERLVGYVKNGFLLAYTFDDHEDLKRRLAEWLYAVNHTRKCDATKRIPAEALLEERPYLNQRPTRDTGESWAFREAVTVLPEGLVPFRGTKYSVSPALIGSVATLFVRENRIDIYVGLEVCQHIRKDGFGGIVRAPKHRDETADILKGRRKRATFRRQCIHELGPVAQKFLCKLVHTCEKGDWEGPCDELFELLREHSETAFCEALSVCLADGCCSAQAVRRTLKAAA